MLADIVDRRKNDLRVSQRCILHVIYFFCFRVILLVYLKIAFKE